MITKIPVQFFSELTEHFSNGLAQALISQMGGEKEFDKIHADIILSGADSGFEGITNNEDVINFFNNNTEKLLGFTEVLSWDMRHDGGEALILSTLDNDNYTIDDVMQIMHPEDCDLLTSDQCRLDVARMVVLNAVDMLARNYQSFKAETAN